MVEDNSLTDAEKKSRKKAERERKRLEAREAAEKKKRFALTPEKKRKLKLLIMKMATENLKAETERKLAAKKSYIDSKLQPLPNVSGMNEASLVSMIKDMHRQIVETEEAKYDIEMKIRKHDYEINELTIKVNDIKGKFVKPTLKKVKKIQNKFAKIETKAEPAQDFRANLKSTGKDKFALTEESPEDAEKVNLRDQLKKSKKEEDEE
jgi:hypothetical protein